MNAKSPVEAPKRNNPGGLAAAPSIFQLGLLLAATDRQHESLDVPGNGKSDLMDMLVDRERDLWPVVASMPAATLADAAVQIGVGYCISGILESSVWTGEDQQELLHRYHSAIYRICLSTLPLLAAAAGLDIEAMGWGHAARLRSAEFGGEEA